MGHVHHPVGGDGPNHIEGGVRVGGADADSAIAIDAHLFIAVGSEYQGAVGGGEQAAIGIAAGAEGVAAGAGGADGAFYSEFGDGAGGADADVAAAGIEEERACGGGAGAGVGLEGGAVVGGVEAQIDRLVAVGLAADDELSGGGVVVIALEGELAVGGEGAGGPDADLASGVPEQGGISRAAGIAAESAAGVAIEHGAVDGGGAGPEAPGPIPAQAVVGGGAGDWIDGEVGGASDGFGHLGMEGVEGGGDQLARADGGIGGGDAAIAIVDHHFQIAGGGAAGENGVQGGTNLGAGGAGGGGAIAEHHAELALIDGDGLFFGPEFGPGGGGVVEAKDHLAIDRSAGPDGGTGRIVNDALVVHREGDGGVQGGHQGGQH